MFHWENISTFFWTIETYKSVYGSDYHSFYYFDKTHLTWLAIFVVLAVFCVLLFKKSSAVGKRKILIVLTILALADELLKYVFTGLTDQFLIQYLPFHLCSINIFVCTWYTIRPNKVAANILYCLCMPAALIALMMPTWTPGPMANLMVIHSESIHMLLFIYPLLLFFDGFRPDFRTLPKVSLFLILACIPAVILNTAFGTNFFFLNGSSGNPVLALLIESFGEKLYVLAMLALLILVWIIMYIPWILLAKTKKVQA